MVIPKDEPPVRATTVIHNHYHSGTDDVIRELGSLATEITGLANTTGFLTCGMVLSVINDRIDALQT